MTLEAAVQGHASEADASVSVAQVISSVEGPLKVGTAERSLLCLLHDGTLVVSEAHKLDPYVMAYRERLRALTHSYHIQYSSPERIRSLYQDAGEAASVINKTVVQEEVVGVLRDATRLGASDIHIINRPNESLLRFRIHGVLEDYRRLLPQQGEAYSATIYQSMLDVADPYFKKTVPQDGRLKEEFVSSIGLFGARVATRPTERGHLMVMRLLYNAVGHVGLDELGYLPEHIEMITKLSRNKTGINILSGATGSGKSLSLKCALELVLDAFGHAIHVLTIEDPPEYTIPGAVQTPVLSDDWAGAISNAMRLDPDVIQIGELRDLPSATAGFRAGITGHGVWTTLHANDNVSALERLRDLGVDLGLITDPSLVTSLMNQSLVRTLCPHCSEPYQDRAAALDTWARERIEATCDPERVRMRGEGCGECRGGIKGRSLVAEIILPTMGFMDIFRSKGKNAARAHWLDEMGGITKTDHVVRRVNEGRVDPLTAEQDIGYALTRVVR